MPRTLGGSVPVQRRSVDRRDQRVRAYIHIILFILPFPLHAYIGAPGESRSPARTLRHSYDSYRIRIYLFAHRYFGQL